MMVKRSVVDIKAVIGEMVEPLPDEELLKKFPEHKDLFHKPDFLVVKARKQ